jgi:peptidoglycan/LPS O-acetylase OafA/YrhL
MPFTDEGASGVALFFVLSGFLISTLLLREEAKTGDINLANFYARRTLRIFPLYYAVLALYTVLVLLLENNAAGRLFFQNLPYYLTYTSNWFVDLIVNDDGQRRVIFIFAWTLATEEQFYLFWPWAMKLLKRWKALSLLILIASLDIALTFMFGKLDTPASPFERFVRIATSPSTEICAGVLLAFVLHSRSGFAVVWPYLGRAWSAPLAAAFALIVAMWPGEPTPAWYLAQSVVFFFLVASCVIREDHGLAFLLKQPVLARIGVVSYGMYLLHMLAVNTAKVTLARFDISDVAVTFCVALALTYLAAELSYRVFEGPLLRIKSRFSTVGGRRPASTMSMEPRS